MSVQIHPIHLGTFVNVDYSHQVLNTDFGKKISSVSAAFLIVDNGELIMFDTGYRDEDNIGFNLEGNAAAAIKEKFKALNYNISDVKKVILSHLHWDHIGNTDLFPNAAFYVQRVEMQYAAAPVDPLYYNFALTGNLLKNFGKQLVFVEGDYQVSEHVKVSFVGGHSPGSQVAFVTLKKDIAVICGDFLNIYANLKTRSPKEIDVVQWTRSRDRIKEIGTLFIPGHDIIADFERYPAVFE